MAGKVKGVLAMYKEEMKEEMREEYKIEIAKKLKGMHSSEEIARITGLSLSKVLSL